MMRPVNHTHVPNKGVIGYYRDGDLSVVAFSPYDTYGPDHQRAYITCGPSVANYDWRRGDDGSVTATIAGEVFAAMERAAVGYPEPDPASCLTPLERMRVVRSGCDVVALGRETAVAATTRPGRIVALFAGGGSQGAILRAGSAYGRPSTCARCGRAGCDRLELELDSILKEAGL